MGEAFKSQANDLCFNCKNAYCGCSWSRDFVPVEGWIATPTTKTNTPGRETKSYCITYCPEYAEDVPQTAKDLDDDGCVNLLIAYFKAAALEYKNTYRALILARTKSEEAEKRKELARMRVAFPPERWVDMEREVRCELKAMVESRL